jgi:hypothetical protein
MAQPLLAALLARRPIAGRRLAVLVGSALGPLFGLILVQPTRIFADTLDPTFGAGSVGAITRRRVT